MNEDYVSHGEFNATVEKLEAEDERQNHRITELESTVKQINNLTQTVDKLATNMENMYKEQAKQGERLEKLEGRDGENWREFLKILGSAVVGGIIGFLLKYAGLI